MQKMQTQKNTQLTTEKNKEGTQREHATVVCTANYLCPLFPAPFLTHGGADYERSQGHHRGDR